MMTSSRFTIAVHTVLAVEYFGKSKKGTSEEIAKSVGVNPVVIRRTLLQLKAAGLIFSSQGVAGFRLARSSEAITLYDVYEAVEEKQSLFRFHESPNADCPVGGEIKRILTPCLKSAEESFYDDLRGTTIADLLRELD